MRKLAEIYQTTQPTWLRSQDVADTIDGDHETLRPILRNLVAFGLIKIDADHGFGVEFWVLPRIVEALREIDDRRARPADHVEMATTWSRRNRVVATCIIGIIVIASLFSAINEVWELVERIVG